jgi:serine phosphatase RsbU (regulator of sigma subunit)
VWPVAPGLLCLRSFIISGVEAFEDDLRSLFKTTSPSETICLRCQMESQNQAEQNIDQAIEEYEKCHYQLNTLFDFSKDIFGILDIKGILKNSLLFTMGNFGVLDGFVGLFNLSSGETIQFVSQGHQEADLEQLERNVSKTLMQNSLMDPGAIDVRCGDLELLPGSVVCVLPFKVNGHMAGMMGLGSKLIGRPYADDEKKMLVTVVNNMVVALQNAESFEEINALNQDLLENKKQLETTLDKLRVAVRKKAKYSKHLEKIIAALNVAQEVQQSLLPQHPPEKIQFDISGGSRYCDETGGDYYDYIELPRLGPDVYAIAVGDVSGHGISSALLMASVRAYLRSRVTQAGSVAEIITDVNRLVSLDTMETNQFMTLFFLVVEGKSGRLTWVRAGHDPAVVFYPASNQFGELKGGGIPLGVDEDWRYEESTAQIKSGQILVLTTDGIMESHNQEGDMFGKDRIKEVIRRNADLDADGIRRAIFTAVEDFRGKAPREDDVTLVVAKFL